MDQPEIFVSYAWGGESEKLVDQLCESFTARGYAITRDKSDLGYKDSIKAFMERIGRGKFIIVVISQKYMKSEHCMYEAYRMFQSPAFRERVFPIILPQVDLFSFQGQVGYLKYWELEDAALRAEYQKIAVTSPEMAAPLAERLRDIKATTLFINDFMAVVSDMNVLTSQIHIETNFHALIQAIETRMKNLEPEDGREKQTKEVKVTDEKKVNTGGGTYISGGVNTGGGDFVGRDRNTSISIGGNVSGSNIVVGNHNTVTNNTSTQNVFAPVYHAIEQAPISAQEKDDLKAEYKEIETAVTQGQPVDESWLARRLRNLKRMAPAIAEVALAAMAGPGAAVAAIAKQVAERVKAEG